MDENEEEVQVVDPDKDLPRFRSRFSDLPMEKVKVLVRKSHELITNEKKNPEGFLEKNVCIKMGEYLKAEKKVFGGGDGEWQIIIGKNLAACLTYELHMLSFFDLFDYNISVLIFKSGD